MKFSYTQSLIDVTDVQTVHETLEPYRHQLAKQIDKTDYTSPESSIHLPFDTERLEQLKTLIDPLLSKKLRYIIVIGIGGSNLGTQAVYHALFGMQQHLSKKQPEILFLDTLDHEVIQGFKTQLKLLEHEEELLVISISKSGSTIETIANTQIVWSLTKKRFENATTRFLCITDKDSKLWNYCQDEQILCIEIPASIGGRFSVFSSVGLVPLYCAGVDVHLLLEGAQQAVMHGTSNQLEENTSVFNACVAYLQTKEGRSIHNSFFFSPKFEYLGKWYRQLVGESLGKQLKGITPIVSIGSTDLHSMAQLYWDGPDDKFTHLISHNQPIDLLPETPTPDLIDELHYKSSSNIMDAIYHGVCVAYQKTSRPYVEMHLGDAGVFEIGYYLQFRMMEIMYLAKLMNINAFDQPAVELYKKATKAELQ